MRKKLSLFLLSTLFVLSTITGCSKENDSANSTDNTERPQGEEIVTTTTEEGFVYDKDGDFCMMIDDVFSITGKGQVATGEIIRGTVKVGDTVELIGLGDTTITTKITEIEKFRETLDEAVAGDMVGLYLEGVQREDIERGKALIAPGTVSEHTKFTAEIKIPEDVDCESDEIITTDTITKFYFWVTDSTGTITFPDGVTSLKKGDALTITITLNTPMIMHEGTPFTIMSGLDEVGEGTVVEVLD